MVIVLTLEQVLAIHAYQIATFGGSTGIRDLGLLQSALAMPAASFSGHYLHSDLYEMGAAYLFHLVSNHPFLDGNKRVGAAAGAIFLETNNLRFTADPDEYAELTLSVARGEISKPEVAAFYRANTSPV